MSNQPIIMNNEQLIKAVEEILNRGNTAQIQNSKDGIKVLEVAKKIRAVITK